MVVARWSFERGSPMVNRLRTDQEVVVGSPGPAIVADQSAGSPHRDSRSARSTRPSSGPTLLGWVTKLGVCADAALPFAWRRSCPSAGSRGHCRRRHPIGQLPTPAAVKRRLTAHAQHLIREQPALNRHRGHPADPGTP